MPFLDGADDVHGSRDGEQFTGRQAAASLRPPEIAGAVMGTAKRRRAETTAERYRVVGLPQQQLHFVQIKLRLQRKRHFARVVDRRQSGEAF